MLYLIHIHTCVAMHKLNGNLQNACYWYSFLATRVPISNIKTQHAADRNSSFSNDCAVVLYPNVLNQCLLAECPIHIV